MFFFSVEQNNEKLQLKTTKRAKVRFINNKIVQKVGRPRKIRLEKGPLQCALCGIEFVKWIDLKKHESSHKNEKSYKCKECQASFNISVKCQ